MSTTLAEQVEAEQAEYEEGETASDDDAETEAEEDAATTEEEAEQEAEETTGLAQLGPDEFRRAEKASEAQRRKLAGILGDEYVAHECIFCAALGFVPEPPPVGAELEVVEVEGQLTFAVKPPAPEIPLLHAPDKEECPACIGYGEVLTGSKAAHGMVAACVRCAGNGWINKTPDSPVAQAPQPPLYPMPPNVPQFDPNGAPDAWGRPLGHPHYGRDPVTIVG